MKSCKVLMPIGGLGAKINQEAFDNGMKLGPDVIAIDAGSTDSGPGYLAQGMCKFSRAMLKHDLKIAVIGAKKGGIPLFVGSCGTCGTDNMVDECAGIVMEIFKEEGFTGKIAKVYSQQKSEILKKKWDEGKIHPLECAPAISRETFDECTNIVAVLGAEPFIEALNKGADVVLCGRATDTAIIAALPVHWGCNVAAAWHGAKIVECGAQCTDNEEGTGVFLTVDEKGFLVTPLLPNTHCTPYTVAAHLLYENADPFRLTEPSGTMVTNEAVYTQADEQSVYVTGSKFVPASQYTMKLEGAGITGYQNISLVGIANPKVLADPERWIRNISVYVDAYIQKIGIPHEDYSFNFKAYGYNAVIDGPVPEGTPPPREIGMLLTVTAKTQELATQIAKVFNPSHLNGVIHIIIGLLATPLSYLLNTDAMIYGIMPVVVNIGAQYNIPAVTIASMFISARVMGTSLSITTPSVYLALGLMGLSYKEAFKYGFKWSILLGSILVLISAIIVH